MKVLILGLFVVLALGGVSVDAAAKAETLRVQINREKRSPKSKMTVRFVELVEDSRCPTDTNCIWAGNAKIKVRLTRNGRSRVVMLETNGSDKSQSFEGYEIKLTDLTPHPRSNIRINRNGYIAILQVDKLAR